MTSILPGLHYVATPYTKYPQGLEQAFVHASQITAHLLRKGVAAYSPIVHSHSVAKLGGLDALDHSIWLPLDEQIMARCGSCLVAMMRGWDQSFGVQHEIGFFRRLGKPVRLMSVEYSDADWRIVDVTLDDAI
jgi:nucleoside 2-deoxyribosyltransferase